MTIEDIRRIDPSGMYDDIKGFPNNWKQGLEIVRQAEIGVGLEGKTQFVVAGMGGSAIGAELLKSLSLRSARVPVSVVRDYTLPASVDARALVVASSYSGNTEETLSAAGEALQRGATVICIASGGQLLALAQEKGLPFVQIPGGMQPRAALGFSFSVLLGVAQKVGLLDVPSEAFDETQNVLDRQAAELSDPSGNRALEIATALRDRWPIVYTAAGLLEAAGTRWRGQINENAKKLASSNVFPEMNHNEIMGWEDRGGTPARVGVIVLRDRTDHPQVQRRIEVTRELVSSRAAYWTEVEGTGTSELARLLSVVNMGDWVSLYLAALLEIDPTPVELISQLKEAMK